MCVRHFTNQIRAFYLGTIKYNAALEIQNSITAKLKQYRNSKRIISPKDDVGLKLNTECFSPNIILFLQHHPVYTIGIRQTDPANDYTEKAANWLRSLGAEFVRTNRGGFITFHGPGQLVCYPLFDLRNSRFLQPSARWYVRSLESSIIEACAALGVKASTTCDVGVWVKNSKIAAVGVHIGNSITSHGLAINCNNDLSWFEHMVPCGLIGKTVTSITDQLDRNISVLDTLPHLITAMENNFGCLIGLEDISNCSIEDQLRTINKYC